MCSHKYQLTVLLFTVFLLTGCIGGGSTNHVRYYLIDPTVYPNSSLKIDRELSIEIIDLHIPQYLERFYIATRSSESRVEFSESNQWAENFRKNLIRTMSRNLSRLLSSINISTPLNRSSSSPDYRVQINIEQFELDIDSKIKLVARWQLSDGAGSKSLAVFNSELQSLQTIEEDNYDQIVSGMRQIYGELSLRIAETIIELEKK